MQGYDPNTNPSSRNVKFNSQPQADPKRPSRGCWFLSGMGGCGCMILLGAILILYLLGSLFSDCLDSGKKLLHGNSLLEDSTFKREHISGKKDAPNKIAVIKVKGVITSDTTKTFSGNAVSDVLCRMIREAANDDAVKAVIISLDTPGGEVTASDEVYHELTLLRKKKTVTAYMNSICASGGYYIAAACHPIIANKLTLTGSIGVIISTYNYKGLFDKVGLKAEIYTSGKMKDMLNGARDRTPAEDAIIRKLVMNTYNIFTDIVSCSRGIPVTAIRNGIIGDGRIFDGQQALENNLVDKLGYFQDAVELTAKTAGIKGKWEVFQFEESFDAGQFIRELFASAASSIDLLPGASRNKIALEAGKLYFLPPGL